MVRPNLLTRHFVNHHQLHQHHPTPAAVVLPQRCSFGTATANKNERQPNNFTQYMTKMKQVCPDAMKQYAACVVQAQEAAGTTMHGACQEEFDQVKECFRTVRRESFSSNLL